MWALPAIANMQESTFGRSCGFGYIAGTGSGKAVRYGFAPPDLIAQVGAPIPGGVGGFTDFDSLSVTDPNLGFISAALSFRGSGSGGQVGIYYSRGPSIVSKLIARGETLDGKTVADLTLAADNMEDILISFRATFTDGSSGIYLATIPEPSSICAAVLLLPHLARRRNFPAA